jgi:predicted alpha/beta-fold hydrolase
MNMVIRPPRNSYPDDSSENNRVITLSNGRKVVKKVFSLTNPSGNKISCSFYERAPEERPAAQMPCVIYMHGNAGNKNECTSYLELLQDACINLFSFDFSGCGNSEGEWVTLGWKE